MVKAFSLSSIPQTLTQISSRLTAVSHMFVKHRKRERLNPTNCQSCSYHRWSLAVIGEKRLHPSSVFGRVCRSREATNKRCSVIRPNEKRKQGFKHVYSVELPVSLVFMFLICVSFRDADVQRDSCLESLEVFCNYSLWPCETK